MLSNKLYYSDGSLYAVLTESAREYFYKDGKPKTFEPYENQKLHGEVKLYWPNGKLKRSLFFVHGVRCGTDCMWNIKGQLLDEGTYANGKAVGTHRRWNQRGDLIEELVCLDALRFNLREWGELGELSFERIWIDKNFVEKQWDDIQKQWIEKRGYLDEKKLVYL